MTNPVQKTLQSIALLSAMAIIFSSCLKDKCEQLYTYKYYKPIYMSFEDLRIAVKNLPATDLKSVGKIYYKAPYIFVNEIDKGIHVIDNTNPSAPQNVAFINIPGNLDIAIKDNILYADSYIDLVALDISNPLAAVEVWRSQQVFPQRNYNGWVGDATLGVITNWIETDTMISQDCTNYSYWLYDKGGFAVSETASGGLSNTTPGSPGVGVAGSLARFGISNDYLYCLANPSIQLFDIQNPGTPINNGVVSSVWNAETLFPYQDYLFVGTTTGVSIYSNTNPSSPYFLTTVTHVTGCDPVVVEGNYAYSTIHAGNMCGQSWNELSVIDISNISSPYISATYNLSSPYGLGIDGDKLFVCDDAAGLKMYDASNPNQLKLMQTVTAGNTRDVIPLGEEIILVSTTGIYQFDYSTGTMVQLSMLPITH